MHIHHGIRGDSADADERYVKALCRQLGVRYLAFHENVEQYAKEQGLTLEEAKQRLSENGFSCRTVGSGAEVTDQTPVGGSIVPGTAEIILYLGEEKPTKKCVVPKVIGMTAEQANTALTNAGLIMKVMGDTSNNSGTIRVSTQSVAEGGEVEAGTVVSVQLTDTAMVD